MNGFLNALWVGLLFVACSTAPEAHDAPDTEAVDAHVMETKNDDSSAPGDDIGDTDDAVDVTLPPRRPVTPVPCVNFTPDADDPSAALFAPECVIDVHVTISPKDWNTLRQQTRTFVDIVRDDCHAEPYADVFTWFEADVTVSGQKVSGVGIRKKGFLGSLSADKPSLKIRFDKYVDGQRLAALSRMTLNNMLQDPSLINACLGYAVMAKAGLPAPRCNFARVFVNEVDLGIYAHVDSIKKPFLARHFESDEGNLYEATLSDFRPTFRGTWEKKTNKLADDWSDLDAAVTALTATDEDLMGALDAIFDLDAFYTFWATEVLIGHWDGYAGNLNNTYLYADPSDGRFRFIPWGVDSAPAKAQKQREAQLPRRDAAGRKAPPDPHAPKWPGGGYFLFM